MIRCLEIDNFKSLVDFKIPLVKFTCLVGMNGAGKTTLLQAIAFLAQVMTGEIKEWLKIREWNPADVLCHLPGNPHKRVIQFKVELLLDEQVITWTGRYNADKLRCTSESISINGKNVLVVKANRFLLKRGSLESIQFTYQGSILSAITVSILEKTDRSLIALKQFFQELKSSELLAPHLMRQRARLAEDIGVGGEKLSAFLHKLSTDDRNKINAKLGDAFSPTLQSVQTRSLRFGWKELAINEKFGGSTPVTMKTEARHINDGLLRQLAIIAQTLTKHHFLLFDEIENGMNQEIVGRLIDILRQTSQQVMVTTHSPLILNFLPDEEARQGVILLFKTPEGFTKAEKYFDLAITQEKLGVLGPGEVYSDTPLAEVVEEAIRHNRNHKDIHS